VAQGITREMAAASRRRYVLMQGLLVLVLGMDLALGRGASAEAPNRVWPLASLLAVLVAASVWRFIRWSPRPGRSVSQEELAELARGSHRCAHCQTVLLPGESEYPSCGAMRHPGWALGFGLLFGLAMVLIALWRIGLLTG
jgi:hypothetical protein